MQKKITILIDFDGTMMDTEKFYMNLMMKFNSKKKYHFSKKFYIENCLGKTKSQITESLKKIWGSDFDFELYWKEILKIRDSEISYRNIKYKKGFTKLLEYVISKNYNISIVSSSSIETINKILENTNIDICKFDRIFSRELVERVKPFPDLYNLALDYYNYEKDNIYVIEDSEVGIESAYNAGLSVLYVPDIIDDCDDTKYIQKFTSLDEIILFLKNLE